MSGEVDAGEFGDWLRASRDMLRGGSGAQVPCGDCRGCCVSSYFIPIRSEDGAARARIPARFLTHAPGQPEGHDMMGYHDNGHCPMFSAGECMIYADRPQTCRDYDCRIFAAAGIEPGGAEKRIINERVRAWRFSYLDEEARRAQEALRAAAVFIRDRRDSFPGARCPSAPTGIAVLALKAYTVFLDAAAATRTDVATAEAIIQASRAFDAGGAAGTGNAPSRSGMKSGNRPARD